MRERSSGLGIEIEIALEVVLGFLLSNEVPWTGYYDNGLLSELEVEGVTRAPRLHAQPKPACVPDVEVSSDVSPLRSLSQGSYSGAGAGAGAVAVAGTGGAVVVVANASEVGPALQTPCALPFDGSSC